LDEDEVTAGRGTSVAFVSGPFIQLCDGHGPGVAPSSKPLAEFEICGSGGVPVVVDDCVASFQTHGFVHSDDARSVYYGPVTIEGEFEAKGNSAKLTVTVYTPKAAIQISGDAELAALTMDTCA
jgi:hypothetical protein